MVEDRTAIIFPSQGFATASLCPPDGLVCCVASGPGGRQLRVLLDTGTDPSAIDAGLARRLALRTGGSGVGHSAVSDAVRFTEAVLPWLRIGDLVIRDLFAPALDLSGLPFQVDIVLGYNVLHQLAIHIDHRRRTLTLAHPDLGAPPLSRACVTLPLAFFEHFPAIGGVEVDGRAIALATIDTGSNGALTVGPDLAGALGLARGAVDVTPAHGSGFGGAVEVVRRRCRTLRVGPFLLNDIEIDTHLGLSGDFGRSGRANIGNQLLARFAAVAIDYERRTIALDPDPGAPLTPRV